jgi:hypothetical protein
MKKTKNIIGIILGIGLVILGILSICRNGLTVGLIPVIIGIGLIIITWTNNRVGMVIFGHICIVVGAYLITFGIYLLPQCKPTFLYIIGMPLFWGIFCLFGGICAIFHGMCNCVRNFRKK